MVSIKNPSPALPTANNTVSHVPTPGGQPQALAEPTAIASPLSSAGVAYAIISTSPSNAAAIAPSTAVPVVSESLQVQPLLISADSKVSARPWPRLPACRRPGDTGHAATCTKPRQEWLAGGWPGPADEWVTVGVWVPGGDVTQVTRAQSGQAWWQEEA